MQKLTTKLSILSIALLTAGLGATSALSQTTQPGPSPAASAGMVSPSTTTRAEVKEELKASQRAGDMPQGEAGVTKKNQRGGAVANPGMKGENSRSEVAAETKRARAAGEIPQGEAGATADRPKGGAKIPKTSSTTRAEVKAEAKRAEKAGEIPKGEASMPAKPKTL